MQQGLILVRADEVVAVVEINCQVARNALSVALISDLTSALDRIDANPAVKVMVLTGAAAHFAAGTDIKEMLALGTAEVSATDFSGCSERLASMRKPVIAAVSRCYEQ